MHADVMKSFAISIHAPRGGSDRVQNLTKCVVAGFQSTLPVGGATPSRSRRSEMSGYFNPRSPWGERPRIPGRCGWSGAFQSTLPVGGATQTSRPAAHWRRISIHAPRGGSDNLDVSICTVSPDFNPRSPWGERRKERGTTESINLISIHAPRGGSDLASPVGILTGSISIHAPRGGSDLSRFRLLCCAGYFNPRSPWGERRVISIKSVLITGFQSTLPVGGATSLTTSTKGSS